MSAKTTDKQDYCNAASIRPGRRQPCLRTAAQSFDLDAEFRLRFNLNLYNDEDDDEEEDCELAVSPGCSEFSDYVSMSSSAASSTMLPPGFDDRLSLSSGDSFCLDDDDNDRCSISTLENIDDGDENAADLGTAAAAAAYPPFFESVTGSAGFEDLEFDFMARTTNTVCRSASLKSSYESTPPSSPRTKKVVRFADALGLDLESVRHILDFGDVPSTSFGRSPTDGLVTSTEDGARVRLIARFSEPGSSFNFLRRVQERKVSLEEVGVDAERNTLSGVIRVANIAYQKQVTVRYSVDNWATYHDHPAAYLPPGGTNTHYDGGLTDAFTFQLLLPSVMTLTGSHLEFSVRFVAGSDLTFWDSNFGNNYAVDCVAVGRPTT